MNELRPTTLLVACVAMTFTIACGDDPQGGIKELGGVRSLGSAADAGFAGSGEQEPLPVDDGQNNNTMAPSGNGQPGETPQNQSPPAGTPMESGLSCTEIITCFNACPENDRPCMDGCFEDGSVSGQAALENLSMCYQTHSCRDEACAREHCLWESNVCQADGGMGQEAAPPAEQAPMGEGLTCNEVFACYGQCDRGDQACIGQCYEDGYPSGRRAVDGIGACIRANQCQDNDCVENNCAGQVRICSADNGVLDVHQPDGRDLTCSEIDACFAQCPGGDEACTDRCYNSGSANAREALSAIGACIRSNDCQDNACVDTQCADAQTRCAEDAPVAAEPGEQPGVGVEGGLTCNQLFDCFAQCDPDNADCSGQCMAQGAPSGLRALDGVGACIEANSCQDQACVTDNCAAQIRICDGDNGVSNVDQPDGRDLTCNEIDSCFSRCAANDQACNDRCYNSGSAEARRIVSAIGVCIRQNNCQNQACLDTQCAAIIAECDANAPAAPAPAEPAQPADDALTCGGIVGCFNQCQNDRDCMNECFAEGTPEGQEALEALSTCIQDNNCEDDACMAANCHAERDACDAQDNEAQGNEPAGQAEGLECVDVYRCSNECPQGDQDCRRGCYENASAQGREEVDAVSACVRDAQCQDDDCARTQCGTEIEACETPDGQPGGEAVLPPAEPEGPDANEEPANEEPANEEPANEEPANEEPANEEPGGEDVAEEEPVDEEVAEEEFQDPESNGTCDAPHGLDFGQTDGTTADAPELLRGACGGAGGEQIFRINMAENTPVCLNTLGSDIDTVLYVRATNCGANGVEVQCNDDFRGVQSQVSFMANANTDYFVVVDSYNASGEFVLNVSAGACQ